MLQIVIPSFLVVALVYVWSNLKNCNKTKCYCVNYVWWLSVIYFIPGNKESGISSWIFLKLWLTLWLSYSVHLEEFHLILRPWKIYQLES